MSVFYFMRMALFHNNLLYQTIHLHEIHSGRQFNHLFAIDFHFLHRLADGVADDHLACARNGELAVGWSVKSHCCCPYSSSTCFWASVRASASWIPHPCGCAKTSAYTATRCSRASPPAGSARWGGSSDLSCT